MEWEEALKSFVVTHHQLADVTTQQKVHNKAKKDASNVAMAWALELPEVKTAMGSHTDVIKVSVNVDSAESYSVVLKLTGGFKEGNVVSDAMLAAAMDGITEEDITRAAQKLFHSVTTDLVTTKDIIAHAVLGAIARGKDSSVTYKLTVKRGVKAPTQNVINFDAVATVIHPPDHILFALRCITEPDALASQKKELASKENDLACLLQTQLKGADQPKYSQPLTINMEGDVRQNYLLKNSTRVKKPSITGHKVHEFFTAVQHDLLNVRITSPNVDARSIIQLTKRLAPNIRAAIHQWQAQNAQVVSRLRITMKK